MKKHDGKRVSPVRARQMALIWRLAGCAGVSVGISLFFAVLAGISRGFDLDSMFYAGVIGIGVGFSISPIYFGFSSASEFIFQLLAGVFVGISLATWLELGIPPTVMLVFICVMAFIGIRLWIGGLVSP